MDMIRHNYIGLQDIAFVMAKPQRFFDDTCKRRSPQNLKGVMNSKSDEIRGTFRFRNGVASSESIQRATTRSPLHMGTLERLPLLLISR